MTTVPDASLASALTALAACAQRGGADPATARAEGEALAATVAESARGAWVDWSEQTGGGRAAEDFTRAASRGRRWRASPTPTLTLLAGSGHPEAVAYARALAQVCTAATTLGEAAPRVIGNAATATSAQLSVFGLGPSAPPVSSADAPPPADRLLGVWGEVMGELSRVRSGMPPRPATPAPALDLGDVDPWGPGAFPGLGSASDPAPSAPPAGSSGDPAPLRDPPRAVDAGEGSRTQTAAPAPDAAAPPAKSLNELLAELDGLIGLAAVKAEIHRQVAVLRIEAKRETAGLRTPSITRHLVFTGNPGTGKTTVARLVAGIYQALGLLSSGQLVEVDRSELVAGYLGQTAIKTAEVVARAAGGVLFIDEAYSLAGDQYGTEAIDTLVKEMEDRRDDLVVVVAGYPVPMEIFVAQNPGLASRFRTSIEFADYTDDELVAIFRSLSTAVDYDVSDAVEERFRALLADVVRGSTFGNGRFARNVLEAAVGRHAWRLRDVDAPTLEQLRALEPQDLVAGDDVDPAAPPEALAPRAEAGPPDLGDPAAPADTPDPSGSAEQEGR